MGDRQWTREDYQQLATLVNEDADWWRLSAAFGHKASLVIIKRKLRYIVRRGYLPQFHAATSDEHGQDGKWKPRDTAIIIACIRKNFRAKDIKRKFEGRTFTAVRSKITELRTEMECDSPRGDPNVGPPSVDFSVPSVSTYSSVGGLGRARYGSEYSYPGSGRSSNTPSSAQPGHPLDHAGSYNSADLKAPGDDDDGSPHVGLRTIKGEPGLRTLNRPFVRHAGGEGLRS